MSRALVWVFHCGLVAIGAVFVLGLAAAIWTCDPLLAVACAVGVLCAAVLSNLVWFIADESTHKP